MGMRTINQIAVVTLVLAAFLSCTDETKDPGYVFMPDMYESPSYEVYSRNPNFADGISARTPAEGSIPRGHMPYPYPNTNEGYEAAGLELKNPISFSETTLEEGKKLFIDFCSHCHGDNGGGQGQLVKLEKFPPVPSFKTQLKDLPEGKMFHSITYGKNLMGSHASQLTPEERWKIIHFLKTLQQ